jgi:hypothetical protein
MASWLSNYLGNRMLYNNFTTAGTNNVTYLALHISDPGVSGDLSTEVRGGGYNRHIAYWTNASAKTVATTNAMVFNDLRPVTITHIAVWDRITAGNMLIRMPLDTAVNVTASGNFIVAIGDVAFTV